MAGDADNNNDPGAVASTAAAAAALAAANENSGADGDGSSAAGTDGDGSSAAAGGEGSLETYADFVMPEETQLDAAALAEATPIFKELGLSQEDAQKVVSLYAKQVQAGEKGALDTFDQMVNDWRDQSKNDKEIGGDNFEENIKVGEIAVSKYGTPELTKLLGDYGISNHPEMIRFMFHVGQTLREDVPGNSGSVTSVAEDRVSLMYPKQSNA